MQEVADVIAEYPPGQKGIDGGGFSVKAVEPGYLYVQFESLKRGHRDDVEFAVIPGTKENAREGQLYHSEKLVTEDAKSHPRYWSQNCYAGDIGRKAPIVVRKAFPEYCQLHLPGQVDKSETRAWILQVLKMQRKELQDST
eukprot:g646.t1